MGEERLCEKLARATVDVEPRRERILGLKIEQLLVCREGEVQNLIVELLWQRRHKLVEKLAAAAMFV